ncbi:Histone acetyltransferase complex subunit [Tulasnella sp. 403]|nr:Histone acetyltransferase complex subunit [Tulasnella sp. 403]
MSTPSGPAAESDPIKRAAHEIALMIQRAREEESSKARVLIEKAQWEAEQLRNEGIRVKESLTAEIEQLKVELANNRAGQTSRPTAMSSAGAKRPRESDANLDATLTISNTDVANLGVSPAAGQSSSGSRKKAKTSNTNNAPTHDELDELADDDADIAMAIQNLDEAQASKAAGTAVAAVANASSVPPPASVQVDVPTQTTEHQGPGDSSTAPNLLDTSNVTVAGPSGGLAGPPAAAKSPPKRAQRKSAIAAKDKIIAAETAADEMDEDERREEVVSKKGETSGDPAQLQAGQDLNSATNKSVSGSLVSPPVVPGRSRGRGGDRASAATTAPAANTSAAPSNTAAAIAALSQHQNAAAAAASQGGVSPSTPHDPSNPYLVRYGDPNNPYAHLVPPPPPGMMMGHNPYMPPGPGYPMFPAGMIGPGGTPYPLMPMPPPPGFEIPGQQAAQTNGEGGEKNEGSKEGEGGEGETATAEGTTNGGAAGTTAQPGQPAAGAVPQQHPYAAYALPPGFATHMPPPEFVHNPNDPNAPPPPHPYPHAHLLPPMHHPHPPNPHQSHPTHLPHPGMQLTLPLAVTDHTLPSHLDALIRAPDSLTITYSEVPEGAYLLRSDFGEPYPKQLEPPRKTTEMRCLFCKRHYSGPNARGMWRRHVTGKHDFVFERKGGAVGQNGRSSVSKSKPLVLDSGDESGDMPTGPSLEGGEGGAHNEGEGQEGREMAVVGPEGMMNLLSSMNGMPVHGLPPGPHPMPNMISGMQVLPGTNIPISSIPPHPLPPSSKRRPSTGRPGVGMGNGGGGLVPRVHPLLTKEERIERARASKRHYAMKRRALEKMKQGGIPKGARLVDGMFILADGTQIPADPNVEYRDLSAPSHSSRMATTSKAGGIGGPLGASQGEEEADDEYDEPGSGKKRPRKSSTTAPPRKGKGKSRRGKKRMDDEIDDDEEDEIVADGEDVEVADAEGLVKMDAVAGENMDPWVDPAAAAAAAIAYHQAQTAVAAQSAQVVVATATTPQGVPHPQQLPIQPYSGKLAEVPFVARGFKPPPMHTEALPPAPKPPRKPNSKRGVAKSDAPAGEEVNQAGEPGGAGDVTTDPATEAPKEEVDAPAGRTRKAALRGKAASSASGAVATTADSNAESAHPNADNANGTGSSIPGGSGLPPGIIPPGEDEDERTFCYCNDVEYGKMISCDNGPNCPKEWFHLACTDLEGSIPDHWYCMDCRQKLEQQKTIAMSTDAPAATSAENPGESAPSSVPNAPQAEPAEHKGDPEAPDAPKPRTRRGRPPKSKATEVEASPPPPAPAAKPTKGRRGGKRGGGPGRPRAGAKVKTDTDKMKGEGDKEASAEPEAEDDNEVESEDEWEPEDAPGQAQEGATAGAAGATGTAEAAPVAAPQSPASSKKSNVEPKTIQTESPGRTRRSARMAAAAAAADAMQTDA